MSELDKVSKPELQAEPLVFENQDLSTLLLQQMKLVEDLTRKLSLAEQQPNQCSIATTNAPKVVQSVLKSLGSDTKYSGSERNSYELWTRFSTQLQSAVSFYPELMKLVNEDSISDIANLKDVQGVPVPGGDLNLGDLSTPKSVITVEGTTYLLPTHTWWQIRGVRLLLRLDFYFNYYYYYYFVNVLQQSHTTDVAAAAKGVLADRRRQLEHKKSNDAQKLVCAVCSGSHPSESCWLMRPDLMEDYIKEHPDREKLCRRLRATKKKKLAREKSEETDTVAAAISVSSSAKTTDEIWEAEEHDEVPCVRLCSTMLIKFYSVLGNFYVILGCKV
eukprot:gene8011-9520_t